jgi:hypothetical protein
MRYLYTIIVPALAAVANAQSAPGFPVQVSDELKVDFQSSTTRLNAAGSTISRQGK